MNFHFVMVSNNYIAKTIFINTYKSLNDLYIGALKVIQELKKAKTSPNRAYFSITKIHDYVHEDGTTKMSNSDDFQGDAPKFDFIIIPLCGIDDVESTKTLFEDGAARTMTMETLKEHALEASAKVVREDDVSIFGGESEMIEHGIFPSVMEASDDVPSSSFINGDDK
ncbi:gag-pol polyprotein [Hordeum vulgare]|nr:gag-pol polyprotein [Hordeum vulgare]